MSKRQVTIKYCWRCGGKVIHERLNYNRIFKCVQCKKKER